ncbi:MAG TPA: methylated-DNA--[protein]-cysteine S-methyltransferase [Clostridiaceae bacterium]|nr:methylated-DNA--[protein]-cysteine S-methyltransferase [Clostridiaceae bacterium]
MVSLLRPENALSNYGFVNFGWFLVAVYGDEQWIKGSDLIPFGSGVADAFLFDCLASKELIDEEGKVTNAFAQLKIGEFLLSGQVRLRPVEQACRELSGYIKGERTRFEVPLDPTRGTEFQQKVWRALRQIPYGQVQSYEEVANRVLYYSELDQGADDESAATEWEQSVAAAIASGTREPEDQSDAADAANDNVSAAHLYARAVGAACGANPFLLFVPCHRVLSKDGKLTGFSSGIENKGHLLDFEIMGAQPDCNIHRDQ